MKKRTRPLARNRTRQPKLEKQPAPNSLSTTSKQSVLPAADFIKVEKNLTSLGLFTPSSKKIKGAKSKTINFTRIVGGNKVEASVTVVPSAAYGLPITADQDKYLALQKLISDIRQQTGEVKNPIGFTSAELLRLLGKQVRSGKNYDDIAEWLQRMTLTGIVSKGVVYLAGKKHWATGTFHVFDQSVSIGKEISDGTIADKNYVWLSEWQLENVNSNHLLPLDYETYKRLNNHITKALVPLLQVWLYATREEGCFEKRYEELCQLLQISCYKYLSDIKRQFAAAFSELISHGYINDWKAEPTSHGTSYKIIFYHGEKFYQDRIKRIGQKEQASTSPKPQAVTNPNTTIEAHTQQEISADQSDLKDRLINRLVDRGADRRWATKYISNVSADALPKIEDLVEYYDWIVSQDRSKVKFPGGFLRTMLEEQWTLPPNFQLRRRQQKQAQTRKEKGSSGPSINLFEADAAYRAWWDSQVDVAIAAKPQTEMELLEEQINEEMQRKFSKELKRWPSELRAECFQQMLRKHIANELRLVGFEEWLQRRTSDCDIVIL